MTGKLNRRRFLGLAGAGSILPFLPQHSFSMTSSDSHSGIRILFQGDSITDGNRGRSADPNHILGHGYAFSIASTLGAKYPRRNLSFLNRGVSGDTVEAIKSRWKPDALDLKPDVISILAGINDVYFRIKDGKTNEPSATATNLRSLLSETKAALPNARLVLCEPFILPVGMVNENRALWEAEVAALQKEFPKIAAEYQCIYVRFQSMFTNAVKNASAEYWIWDGIHPTYNGHGLMANEWLKTVGKEIELLKA